MKIVALTLACAALLCAGGGLFRSLAGAGATPVHAIATIDGGAHPILLGRMTVTATPLP